MSARAAHRGPDDQGLLLFDRYGAHTAIIGKEAVCEGDWIAGLGHRRLSIIDLSSAGHQPMSDPTGRYWIVYNGEVYNHIELRDELIATGCRFSSNTDSEVVLRAVIEWGPACLTRFNGMWAFAVYDSKEGCLFCARDRYGVKPFCYAVEAGRFAFASEAKQLLALPWVRAGASRERLADFFLWGLDNHTDETFFAGIRNLPGSHYIKLTRDDIERGRIEPRRYWEPVPASPMSERAAVVAFCDLLSDSVRLRLRSDVPIGFTLSGGLDSSSDAYEAA